MQFDNFAVGKAIRDLRKEKGISQDVLSGFAGIARTHLTMIENGTKQANFETLWKIALALDIRPSELVARIPNGELTYRPYAPRSYAYLSDTNFSAKAAALAAGADLMYHEATYAAAEQKAARERGHSTTTDAAKAALKAGAKRLVIGHYSSRYKDENMLVEEARAIFPETYPATEGMTFTLEKQR